MKTGTLSLEIKYAFDDWDGDLWIDDLKQAIGKTLFLYGKDYQGHLRLADRNPNKSALWNDLIYFPDVTEVRITDLKEDNE